MDGSGANDILTLDEAARVLARRDVRERDVARQRAKQRHAVTNEHRHAGDDQALDEPGLKKPLNGDPTRTCLRRQCSGR